MQYNENNIKIFFRSFCDCLLENENKIRKERIKLNSLFCFSDSFGYFKYLDKNKKSYIDVSDVSLFLSVNKIKFNKPLLHHIFKKYDKDGDTCWNFSEYLNFINKDINSIYNVCDLSQKEYNIQNYEKELAKLFELEINYIKYIGIKVKSLKELINSNIINSKKIFDLIKQNNDKKNIDVNSLMLFLNNDEFHYDKEKTYKLIQIISNGKNVITERNIDILLKCDKYINDNEIIYPQFYKNFDYKNIPLFNKYKKEFPLNDFGLTNYSIHNISKENQIKDKIYEENKNIEYNFMEIQNNKYFKTSFYNTQDNYKENPLLKSNNSMPQNENIYSNILIDFSFKK